MTCFNKQRFCSESKPIHLWFSPTLNKGMVHLLRYLRLILNTTVSVSVVLGTAWFWNDSLDQRDTAASIASECHYRPTTSHDHLGNALLVGTLHSSPSAPRGCEEAATITHPNIPPGLRRVTMPAQTHHLLKRPNERPGKGSLRFHT